MSMTISKLVAKYEANRGSYLENTYNETQLRADFVDPLFEMLGWDINNSSERPTNEREVLLEESLKENAFSNTKKPDYTFRLFAERKFFVEAKKPSVKIEKNVSAAKQIRRYGYTAKLKISVLSNFEYLAIYDCSRQVDPSDAVTTGRIALYHYTEYETAFEEIKSKLGRTGVYDGTYDEVWSEIENQLKLSSVDELFLKQINFWRLELGKEIYSHKSDLSDDELNDLVQRYLNSLIFLRVCEDRNLEVYKTLLKCAESDDYKALIDVFSKADKKYNAGLFDHSLVKNVITNNSSAFWLIIKQLYFPESAYSFSVLASDILGDIYEIFLAQQLTILDDNVILIKKPENKDRDIVTTPIYIIQSILRETVSNYCRGKSDKEILASTFADIACGSGAFLLELYQLLHDILVDYYLLNDPKSLVQTSGSSYKLTFELKRQIVENCIFGVDKDYNAVEACKFGLYLKLLENEDLETITAPALPNLFNTIQFGNSLISPEYTNVASYAVINPFDFGEKRFDVLVGNPPYMATEDMKKFTPQELPIYKSNFESAYKQFDKYFLFIERGIKLLKNNGYFGYIIPSKFMQVGAAKNLRNLLVTNRNVKKIVSFGANQIFPEKTTYTCLLFLKNVVQNEVEYLEIQDLKKWKIRVSHGEVINKIDANDLNKDGWTLVPEELKSTYKKINLQSMPLEDLIGIENIRNGIQTSANSIYIHRLLKEDTDYFYFHKDNRDWKIEKTLTKPYYKSSTGIDNLNTYRPVIPNSFVIYPYLRVDNELVLVDIEDLENNYKYAFEYLNHYRHKLDNAKRDIKPEPETNDEWYRYGRHQSLECCDVPAKIIVGVLSQGNKYAIDYHGTLISSGGTAGYCMITLPSNLDYSIYYIQAILNSKYLEWCSALIGEIFRGGYIARGTKVLKNLPIRVIDFNNPDEKALHDDIAKRQKRLIQLQGQIDTNAGAERKQIPIQREFDRLKSQLDEDLKSLYSLGETDSLIPMISETYATH